MKKYLIILISLNLFFHSATLFAQIFTSKDYNSDGYADTIIYNYIHFGNPYEITFIDGKNHKKYSFEKSMDYSNFLDIIPINNDLINQKDVLDSIESILFFFPQQWIAQPSLEWLLNAKRKGTSQIDTASFYRVIKADIKWYKWPQEFPSACYQIVHRDSIPNEFQEYYKQNKEFEYCYMIYYGHNHRQYNEKTRKYFHDFTKVYQSDSFEIYKTSHGLILKKDSLYKWIFHTNPTLTGGPSKLRWESIDTLAVYKSHVILNQSAPMLSSDHIFIINLENGNIGMINTKKHNYSHVCYKFRIVENFLNIYPNICHEYAPDEKVNNIEINLDEIIEKLMKE